MENFGILCRYPSLYNNMQMVTPSRRHRTLNWTTKKRVFKQAGRKGEEETEKKGLKKKSLYQTLILIQTLLFRFRWLGEIVI